MMNKILLTLNIVLLAAVGYLYYEHYEYTMADKHNQDLDKKAVLNSFKIAYFELDSLENNYEYYKQVRDYLTKKDSANSETLNKLRSKYLDKAKEFQQKGPGLSQTEQSEYQQQLTDLQYNFQKTQDELNQQLQTEMGEKMRSVQMKIKDFLKKYSSDKGYAFVFASNQDDFIYYKDSIRNITADVINALNAADKPAKAK